MITVLFFAQTRELAGTDSLTLPFDAPITIETLRHRLSQQGEKWALALEKGKLIHTINQTIVADDAVIHDGDEVAYFPPVTGG